MLPKRFTKEKESIMEANNDLRKIRRLRTCEGFGDF